VSFTSAHERACGEFRQPSSAAFDIFNRAGFKYDEFSSASKCFNVLLTSNYGSNHFCMCRTHALGAHMATLAIIQLFRLGMLFSLPPLPRPCAERVLSLQLIAILLNGTAS
jgi:hypothetical protein